MPVLRVILPKTSVVELNVPFPVPEKVMLAPERGISKVTVPELTITLS